MKTVIMKLVKENKTLVEYAEVDANFQKLPLVCNSSLPISVRAYLTSSESIPRNLQ